MRGMTNVIGGRSGRLGGRLARLGGAVPHRRSEMMMLGVPEPGGLGGVEEKGASSSVLRSVLNGLRLAQVRSVLML